jgi:hypothetical protein
VFVLIPTTRAFALAMVTASAAVLASISFPLATSAAETTHDKMMMKTPSSYAELMKMDPEECLKMMDHDNKGYVTKKEYMRFHEALFKKMAKAKADRVTREEWLGQIHSSP